jgi:hypothetical protein
MKQYTLNIKSRSKKMDGKSTQTQEQENQTQEQQTNEEQTQETTQEQNTTQEETKTEETTQEEQTFTNAKDSSDGKYDVQTNMDQLATIKAKFETTQKDAPDTSEFYANLEKHLTKEELELEYEKDKTAYFKIIEEKKEQWIKDNTNDTSELEQELERAELNLAVAKGIETTLKKYPDYNHARLAEFYNDELTNKQKRELDKGSTVDNLADHFEKVYKLYKEKYPTKVKQKETPEVPNVSKHSKQTIDANENLKSKEEDKAYMESIGFRKM